MKPTRLVALVLLVCLVASATPAADPEQRQKTLLAVQVALEQGTELIQKGDFAAAVAVLDKQLPYIDGNRRYLNALRDAYRGHVRQLDEAGRKAEAARMRGFLDILGPPARAADTPVTPPAAKATPVTRANVDDDDDPFAETNHAGPKGKGALASAEQAYEARNYEAAGRLYALADREQPGAADGCQEKWAYCKLFTVARRLDRADGEPPPGLETEVQQAVRMAPKLEGFGQRLLSRLRGGSSEPATDIKHTPRSGNGWAVAETANVRLYHAASKETAEKVVRIAEATRVGMAKKWFGDDPKPWTPRCDIYLHPTGQGYAKATGAPAASPGHSSISLEGGRILDRKVDLRGDDPNLLVGVLPHETTHVVLAGRFGRHHVPRWADEGMAVLSEPRERVEMHLRNLPTHRKDGTLFRVAQLMEQKEYPEPSRIGAFYAQSVSVVDFLCKKKDAATFARFLRDGLDGGYSPALERHYGYRSFGDLERDWQQHAFGGAVASADE